MKMLQIGEEFNVLWSNCAGYSIYKIVDNTGLGPHILQLVKEVEYSTGTE